MALSENLRTTRLERGLTQEQIAKEINVNRVNIAYFESGVKVPSVAVLVAIADVLECSIDGLLQAKADRATAMRINAENRRLKLLFENPQWKDMQLSGIGIETLGLRKLEDITGIDMGNALPQTEKTWSATEIGKDFGVSAQAIGKKANALGIKTSEYGITVMDKSRYSNKEVPAFRYNKKGYDTLARAFGIS